MPMMHIVLNSASIYNDLQSTDRDNSLTGLIRSSQSDCFAASVASLNVSPSPQAILFEPHLGGVAVTAWLLVLACRRENRLRCSAISGSTGRVRAKTQPMAAPAVVED